MRQISQYTVGTDLVDIETEKIREHCEHKIELVEKYRSAARWLVDALWSDSFNLGWREWLSETDRKVALEAECFPSGFYPALGWRDGSLQGLILQIHEPPSVTALASLRRGLRERGWKLKKDPHQSPDAGFYELDYERDELKLTVRAWFFGKGRCKFVQTGMKEVPVMELRCE